MPDEPTVQHEPRVRPPYGTFMPMSAFSHSGGPGAGCAPAHHLGRLDLRRAANRARLRPHLPGRVPHHHHRCCPSIVRAVAGSVARLSFQQARSRSAELGPGNLSLRRVGGSRCRNDDVPSFCRRRGVSQVSIRSSNAACSPQWSENSQTTSLDIGMEYLLR